MNKPSLKLVDIYPEYIQDAYELCEKILIEDYGYTEQDFFRYVTVELEDFELDDLTNKLISIMYRVTYDLVKQKKPDYDVDFEVDGMCSFFYINGEQQ